MGYRDELDANEGDLRDTIKIIASQFNGINKRTIQLQKLIIEDKRILNVLERQPKGTLSERTFSEKEYQAGYIRSQLKRNTLMYELIQEFHKWSGYCHVVFEDQFNQLSQKIQALVKLLPSERILTRLGAQSLEARDDINQMLSILGSNRAEELDRFCQKLARTTSHRLVACSLTSFARRARHLACVA